MFEFFFCFPGWKQVFDYLQVEHQSLKALQQRVMQHAGDTGALVHSLFQAKFQNAPRYGPAEESGDQDRGDGRYRHDKKNLALNISHVRDGARQLFIEFAVNALDVGRSRSLNSFEFVVKANANHFPVACRSQGGDVIELKRQSDLNRVQSS